jgi:hypothetical protein
MPPAKKKVEDPKQSEAVKAEKVKVYYYIFPTQ